MGSRGPPPAHRRFVGRFAGELTGEDLNTWKDEALIRAQSVGDVENGLVVAGQVASGIHDWIEISDFVPRMAEEAVAILRGLAPTGAPV